jgi:hypothetical protein
MPTRLVLWCDPYERAHVIANTEVFRAELAGEDHIGVHVYNGPIADPAGAIEFRDLLDDPARAAGMAVETPSLRWRASLNQAIELVRVKEARNSLVLRHQAQVWIIA